VKDGGLCRNDSEIRHDVKKEAELLPSWRQLLLFTHVPSGPEEPVKHNSFASYLNNHLSGAAAELELARRAASSFRGSPEERFFREYLGQLEEDRELMRQLLRASGHQDGLQRFGRWAMEAVVVTRMADAATAGLSRLLQVEGALIGAFGRQKLWEVLERGLSTPPGELDFPALRERAERQSAHLERLLRMLAATSFTEEGSGS
jgi:hypothetical protein